MKVIVKLLLSVALVVLVAVILIAVFVVAGWWVYCSGVYSITIQSEWTGFVELLGLGMIHVLTPVIICVVIYETYKAIDDAFIDYI